MLLGVLALAGETSGRQTSTAPRLLDLRVGDGGAPFAGDRRLLTTVSPNGDGLRDEAIVRFRLDRAANVTMAAVRTDTIRSYRRREAVISHTSVQLGPGPHRLVWRPRAELRARRARGAHARDRRAVGAAAGVRLPAHAAGCPARPPHERKADDRAAAA